MNKSYDYIMGGSKFFNLFDFISGIIICTLFSFWGASQSLCKPPN